MIVEQENELKNTQQRLAELRTSRAEQAASVDNLQEQYIAGGVSLDKLQTAQTKLATFDDLIKSLDAKREDVAARLAQARAKHQREERLRELDQTDLAAANARLRYMAAFDEMDALLAEPMPGLLELFGEYLNQARSFSESATNAIDYRELCEEVKAYRRTQGRSEPIVCNFLNRFVTPDAPNGFIAPIESALNIQRIKATAQQQNSRNSGKIFRFTKRLPEETVN